MVYTSIVIAMLLVTGQVEVQTTDWIGVKVFPKRGAVVKAGDEIVQDGSTPASKRLPIPWTVQGVDGDVLLVGGDRKGWVDRSQVVTLDEASAYFTKLIRQNPNDGPAYNMRATARKQKGELDLAIADFSECVRLDPADPAPYFNRGNVWAAKKQYDKALSDYDEAIKLDAGNAVFHYNKACCHAVQGERDRAIESLEQAVSLGHSRIDLLRTDPDLTSLRSDPRFKALVERLRK
jgi:hypothetical protein